MYLFYIAVVNDNFFRRHNSVPKEHDIENMIY
jgi:hypothetical protein